MLTAFDNPLARFGVGRIRWIANHEKCSVAYYAILHPYTCRCVGGADQIFKIAEGGYRDEFICFLTDPDRRPFFEGVNEKKRDCYRLL